MGKLLHDFWVNEEAQDLVEYTLLIALTGVGVISLLKSQGAGVSTIWVSTSTTVHNAAVALH